MASATTTSTAFLPTATQQPVNDLTDLFNSVGTAVLPLLTLFGDEATKQFLSTSTGWADHLLLVSGPIGIMTIIVSAIRVGGSKPLKAIIGRYVLCFKVLSLPFREDYIGLVLLLLLLLFL